MIAEASAAAAEEAAGERVVVGLDMVENKECIQDTEY